MHHHSKHTYWLWGTLFILVGALSYCGYRYTRLARIHTRTLTETASQIQAYDMQIADLTEKLSATGNEITLLTDALHASKDTIAEHEHELKKLRGDVGTLRKLTEIDPELLKKYSKVYFLNEHYIPTALTTIDKTYSSNKDRIQQIHASVWPYLEKMLETSTSDGVDILVASSYRSYGTQAILKSNYKITYGTTAANRFSAEQGYSEHQLGTTVDLTTAKTGTLSGSFDTSPEFAWLKEHAHEYGFVLSYPKNNKYYIYEPWHWRFVGTDLASKLHEDGIYLYEMDQREIDSYLVNIFE